MMDLLEYRVVEIPKVPRVATAERLDSIATNVALRVVNEPVELLGEASPAFLVALVRHLSPIATEIVYRPNPAKRAVVLYTILEPGRWIRPDDVTLP